MCKLIINFITFEKKLSEGSVSIISRFRLEMFNTKITQTQFTKQTNPVLSQEQSPNSRSDIHVCRRLTLMPLITECMHWSSFRDGAGVNAVSHC